MGLLTDFALGAVAGAAKGFTDYGNTLFSVETEKERLRELQRIKMTLTTSVIVRTRWMIVTS